MRKEYYFMIDYYKKYFSRNSGNDWYSITIDSIIQSAIQFEAQKKELNSFPVHIQFEKIRILQVSPEFSLENLIGLVLVLCQTYISNIVRNVSLFYKDYESFTNNVAVKIPYKKNELIENIGNKINEYNITDIQVINTLANYYKHHEEWSEGITKQNQKSIELINKLGGNLEIGFYWAQNLQKIIRILGINSVSELGNLLLIIDQWKFKIMKEIPELCIDLPTNWNE